MTWCSGSLRRARSERKWVTEWGLKGQTECYMQWNATPPEFTPSHHPNPSHTNAPTFTSLSCLLCPLSLLLFIPLNHWNYCLLIHCVCQKQMKQVGLASLVIVKSLTQLVKPAPNCTQTAKTLYLSLWANPLSIPAPDCQYKMGVAENHFSEIAITDIILF